jgi:hypothetical protein
MRKSWLLGAVAALVGIAAVAAAGCGGGSDEATSDERVAALQRELTGLRQDAKYWQQLTNLMQPVELSSMSDHRAYMLPSGVVVALHFDNLKLDKAKNLNWLALGFPGVFCKADQERIERQYGQGFTHFHDLKNNAHGGRPGAEGIWLVHAGVRSFEAPWGRVDRGIDQSFMPTKAPSCA